MCIQTRAKKRRCRPNMTLKQCGTQEAGRCTSRPDTSPGMVKTQRGVEGIISFFGLLGSTTITYRHKNMVSIPDLQCRHYGGESHSMNKILGSILLALWFFTFTGVSPAKELLFQAEPANHNYARGLGKKLGEAHRTEFDPRMFSRQTWHQRLSYSSYKPVLDETLEIYTKPDGSRWLSHRQAKTSLTGLILRRVVH